MLSITRRHIAFNLVRHASTTATVTVPASSPTPTAAAANLPKLAPHDGVPFKAVPNDTTRGDLGQVFMPDMDSVEPISIQQIKIPSEPDNYSTTSSNNNGQDDFPSMHSPRVQTVAHPATYPSAPTHGSTADDAVIESITDSDSSQSPGTKADHKEERERTNSKNKIKQDKQDSNHKSSSLSSRRSPAWTMQWPKYDKNYENEDRALNAEERRGLVVLGGIVLGGFLLGGIGNRKIRNEKVETAEK